MACLGRPITPCCKARQQHLLPAAHQRWRSRRTLQGPNGWAALDFGATTSTIPGQAQQSITPLRATLNGATFVDGTGTHFGLPAIGAMFHNYTNASVASAYGGVIPHRYARTIDTLDRGTP